MRPYYAVITPPQLLQLQRQPAVNKRSPKQKVLIRCVSVGGGGLEGGQMEGRARAGGGGGCYHGESPDGV